MIEIQYVPFWNRLLLMEKFAEWIFTYTKTLTILEQYDKGKIETPKGTANLFLDSFLFGGII